MSVLSSPQGTPERVWSLVAGLAALGGECERSVFDALLNPGFTRDGQLVQAKETLAANALGAASSLGLIDAGREKAILTPQALSFEDTNDLADFVHDRLVSRSSGETDAPIFDAYAWMVAESDRKGGTGWIFSLGRDEFADAANTALVGQDDDGRLMNTTKVVAWRRWLTFLGLGTPLPIPNVADFPTPAARLVRELKRANTSNGATMPAEQFLALISGRMPYLDRGRLFIQACQRIGHASSQRRLSPLVSVALRDLHDEGILRLNLSGDASVHVQLAEDPSHSVDAFTSVSIFPVVLE
jgi:hypothetical protein